MSCVSRYTFVTWDVCLATGGEEEVHGAWGKPVGQLSETSCTRAWCPNEVLHRPSDGVCDVVSHLCGSFLNFSLAAVIPNTPFYFQHFPATQPCWPLGIPGGARKGCTSWEAFCAPGGAGCSLIMLSFSSWEESWHWAVLLYGRGEAVKCNYSYPPQCVYSWIFCSKGIGWIFSTELWDSHKGTLVHG